MNRVFIDMDGVLADFYRLRVELNIFDDTLKAIPGAYKNLYPIPGALAAVQELTDLGYECWVASKPAVGLAQTYADKADWVHRHLPYMERRIILTQDKGLLGDVGDYLIDDRPHKANCDKFVGQLIHFKHQTLWTPVMEYFRALGRPRQVVEYSFAPGVKWELP